MSPPTISTRDIHMTPALSRAPSPVPRSRFINVIVIVPTSPLPVSLELPNAEPPLANASPTISYLQYLHVTSRYLALPHVTSPLVSSPLLTLLYSHIDMAEYLELANGLVDFDQKSLAGMFPTRRIFGWTPYQIHMQLFLSKELTNSLTVAAAAIAFNPIFWK
jgi:hypothetical protein